MTNKEEQQTPLTRRTDAIQRLLSSGRCFALYRLPKAHQQVELVMQEHGKAKVVSTDDTQLDGFIFAPFNETKECPTLLIQPNRTVTGWKDITNLCSELTEGNPTLQTLTHQNANAESASVSLDYEQTFARIHKQILDGEFEKLVLSYCQANKKEHLRGHEAEVFLRAIDAYPNSMVFLVYTPQSGLWMGCTPEVLLHRTGRQWKTVALAGTIQDSSTNCTMWDPKNIHEQDVVSKYITTTLQGLGAHVKVGTCETMHIGNLSHRRTEFTFCFDTEKGTSGNDVSEPKPQTLDIVRALHPTPAVCGVPKEKAKQFLLQNEQTERNYFSGYLGRLQKNGDAQIFVCLRCAQITEATTYYHAGGGLTSASRLEEERHEIDLKMDTLKTLLCNQ